MSTDMHLHCLSHDPPLQSAEVGLDRNIEVIRTQVAKKDEWLRILESVYIWDIETDGFTRALLYFIQQHPTCKLALLDEYGKEYSLEPESSEEPYPTDAELLAAVRELHKPVRAYQEHRFKPWCGECSQSHMVRIEDGMGEAGRVWWPCKTAIALGMTDPLEPDNQKEQA